MKKGKVMAMSIMAVTLAGIVTGCGNKASDESSVSAKENVDSTVKASVTMEPITDCINKVSDTAIVLTDKAMEEANEEDGETMQAATDSSVDIAAEKPKSDNMALDSMASGKSESGSADVNTVPTSKPSTRNSKSGSSGSSNGSAPNPVTETPKPHTHDWKEHTATRQVWVPNIVVIDDYEEQVVNTSYYECDCGVKFPMTREGSDALTKHQDDAMNGYLEAGMDPFTTCGNSTIYEQYKTEKVKVGSHEEDQGHYENETYVDGYYCDCGAIK